MMCGFGEVSAMSTRAKEESDVKLVKVNVGLSGW